MDIFENAAFSLCLGRLSSRKRHFGSLKTEFKKLLPGWTFAKTLF